MQSPKARVLSLILLFFTFCLFPMASQAKRFKNSYVSFDLPPGWDCQLKSKAWYCRFKPPKKCRGPVTDRKACYNHIKKTKEAIFILTAKAVGQRDKFKNYHEFLKKPRPILTENGQKTSSKVIHLKTPKIKKHQWLDGMHLGSEIPHYYTRYLATINGKVAILVTLSAHKLYYTKYSAEFFRTIKSLKILTDTPQEIDRREFQAGKTGTLGRPGEIDFDGLDPDGRLPGINEPSGNNRLEFMLLFGAIFLALLGILFWVRNRR